VYWSQDEWVGTHGHAHGTKDKIHFTKDEAQLNRVALRP
jgi:hypothetical protein